MLALTRAFVREQEPAIIASTTAVERTSESPRLRVGPRLRELIAHREVLVNLIRKELKVKYTASVLGAVWSLLNPVVFLAVFSFVAAVFRNRVPDFPVFLLSGLLAWNFVANALQARRQLRDRQRQPRQEDGVPEGDPAAVRSSASPCSTSSCSPPCSSCSSACRGTGSTCPSCGCSRSRSWSLVVFATALSLWIAALNVRYRDVGHLLNLALLVWFWATPIVYQGWLVQDKLETIRILGFDAWVLYLLNPVAVIVLGFQRALYGVVVPEPGEDPVLPLIGLSAQTGMLFALLGVSVLLLFLAWRSFFHRSGDFAEEL